MAAEQPTLKRRLKRFARRRLVSVLSLWMRRRGRRGMAGIVREGERFGRIHHAASPRLRRRLAGQIARVLGTNPRDPVIAGILKSAFRVNDRAVFEILALACNAVDAGELAATVEFEDAGGLEAHLAGGRGAILLGMHAGNVFALLAALARRGLPISVIAYQSRKLPDRFFENMLAGTGIQTIQARPEFAAFYELNRAVKRGRAAFIPMDQIHKNGGVEACFLGKRVTMPGGPAALARKLGVPIFPVMLESVESGRPGWRFSIGRPIDLAQSGRLEDDVARLSAVVDAEIRRHPALWSWHQRRWHRYAFIDPE